MSEQAVSDPAAKIAMVDYLVLGDDPHLVANECTSCGARYFDRRNACASCFATGFASPGNGGFSAASRYARAPTRP